MPLSSPPSSTVYICFVRAPTHLPAATSKLNAKLNTPLAVAKPFGCQGLFLLDRLDSRRGAEKRRRGSTVQAAPGGQMEYGEASRLPLGLSSVWLLLATLPLPALGFHDCVQPNRKGLRESYIPPRLRGRHRRQRQVAAGEDEIPCSAGLCVGMHNGPHEGGTVPPMYHRCTTELFAIGYVWWNECCVCRQRLLPRGWPSAGRQRRRQRCRHRHRADIHNDRA